MRVRRFASRRTVSYVLISLSCAACRDKPPPPSKAVSSPVALPQAALGAKGAYMVRGRTPVSLGPVVGGKPRRPNMNLDAGRLVQPDAGVHL